MIEYGQVRKGMVIVEGGELCQVLNTNLNTPGNWRAILTIKLRNLKTGTIVEKRFRPQDKVEQAYLEKREMEYLYEEKPNYVFMDTETYDQITIPGEFLGDDILYLKPNARVMVTFHEGKALGVELPASVDLEVIETEPALKGATAAAQYKPATLETGLKIQVPPFINVGDKLTIDTRSGEYLSRAKE